MSQRTSNDYGLIPNILRESKDRRCRDLYLRPNMQGGMSYCALGTIYHKMGLSDIQIIFNKNKRNEVWKKLGVGNTDRYKICPLCQKVAWMRGLLAHLNDSHNLKWGEIADNLEIAKDYDRAQYSLIQHWQNIYFGIK